METSKKPKREFTHDESVLAMSLAIVAVVLGIYAIVEIAQMGVGVGFVGVACLVAIFARMAQARAQHAELRDLLGKPKPE